MDNLFRFLGLGAAIVRREELPRSAPRALDDAQRRLLLQAAEESTSRDRAIVALLLFTGLRLSEAADLRVADVRISARKGLVVVRSGKGDAYREVELNALVRAMLDEWVDERTKIALDGETSFFVSGTGSALSSRSIDLAVRRVAGRAGLQLSAHVLRHTFVTGLVRAGNDVVLVAELAGHRRLENDAALQLAVQGRPSEGGGGSRDRILMPVEILTAAQRAEWERFPEEIDDAALAAFVCFADDEVETIAGHRGVHRRFAVAVAVGALRWLGFVPAALDELPAAAAALIASQLDVELASIAPARLNAERGARAEHLAHAMVISHFRACGEEDLDALRSSVDDRALGHDGPLALCVTPSTAAAVSVWCVPA